MNLMYLYRYEVLPDGSLRRPKRSPEERASAYKQTSKAWKQENQEKVKAYKRKWAEQNPEKVKEIQQRALLKKRADPHYLEKQREYMRKWYASKKAAGTKKLKPSPQSLEKRRKYAREYMRKWYAAKRAVAPIQERPEPQSVEKRREHNREYIRRWRAAKKEAAANKTE